MSSPTSPAEVVEAFIARIESLDLDGALQLVAPDCEYDNVPVGPVRGHEAIRSILGPLARDFDEVRWEVLRCAVNGNTVFNERVDRFRRGQSWVNLPVTGVWVVEDGLITLWRDYFDLATYTGQAYPAAR